VRRQAAAAPGALGRLLAALREPSPVMRLLACRCLVALAAVLPEDAAPHSPEARPRHPLPRLFDGQWRVPDSCAWHREHK